MLKHKWFVLVGIIALTAAGPALAQADQVAESIQGGGVLLSNPQSITGETTFGLMENEGDFIWQPAELGQLQGWKRDRTIGNKWDPAAKWDGGWFLLSNLGNTTASDSFQLGTWGKLGPGNLAIIAAFKKYKYEDTYSDDYGYRDSFGAWGTETEPPYYWSTYAPSYDYSTVYNEKYKAERQTMDLYAAYGFPIGKNMTLGFSWRHGDTSLTPEDYNQSNNYNDVSYTDVPADQTSYVDRMSHLDYVRSLTQDQDSTTDSLAVEFKMRPTADMSFLVHGAINMIDQHLKYTLVNSPYDKLRNGRAPGSPSDWYCYYDYMSGACNSMNQYYDSTGTLYAQDAESASATEIGDISYDGTEWALGGKFNWYRGLDGLQVDLLYSQGDFDLKSSRPDQWTAFETEVDSSLVGEGATSLTETWNHRIDDAYYATLGNQDLTSKTWLLGGKYMWQWDNVDFLAGLRYTQRKTEVTFGGQDLENWVHTDIELTTPPDTYSTSVDARDWSGVYDTGHTIDQKYLDLPLAAIVHINNKLALLFGVQHTIYTGEVTSMDSYVDNYVHESQTYNGDLIYDYTDATSYNREAENSRTKMDQSYTIYRLGLEYKVSDHLAADFMASETSGNSDHESTGLDRVTAGVSIRF